MVQGKATGSLKNGGTVSNHWATYKDGRKRWSRGREEGCQQQALMNILSYNVRGLGRGIKWASIRRLRKLEGPDLICLQETKKEFTDKAMCQAIWGDSEVSWEMQPTINSAGCI